MTAPLITSAGRPHIRYAGKRSAQPSFGHSPDEPVAGHYRMRLRSGAVPVAVCIWFGPPIEPWTGEEMDRAPRWNATINTAWADVAHVWPRCAGDPIDEAEARYLISTHEWGKAHAPGSPQANPMRRVDLLTAPLPF